MTRLVVPVVLLLAATRLTAQDGTLARALQLERRGNNQAAAGVYQEMLKAAPADVNALLGLERVLGQLGRPGDLTAPVIAALAVQPRNPALYAIAVRAWSTAGRADSVRRAVDRWAELEPGSEAPYREWGYAALGARDHATAWTAYRLGRERLGRTDALAADLARLATLEGDYPTAITEWVLAIRQAPGHRATALSVLSQVPENRRGPIVSQLERREEPVARQLAAGLAARWGEPLRGVALLQTALPSAEAGIELLQEFLTELRGPSAELARARARLLELLADRSGPEASHWLAEAARAYADAGDQGAARRVLDRLSRDPSASPGVAASAAATLIGVLIGEGRLAEADSRLRHLGPAVTAEERQRLTHQLVRGWLRAGELDRSERLLLGDSTIQGLALLGRVRLYRGDLAGAQDALVAGGPFAGERAEVTSAAEVLALLQVIPEDSLPTLGRAFLSLERGDTAAAARGFEAVAGQLPPEAGGAELLLAAGRLRGGLQARAEAERLLRAAAGQGAPAAAAAAGYELGGLLARQGRTGEAVAVLEQLIIRFPESAVAPQARRLLDAVRGGTPPA